MQKLVKHVLYTFLAITAITALVTISGICYAWYKSPAEELPYLKWLISSVLIEIAGVIFLLAKNGMKYLPEVVTHKTKEDTQQFMEEFILSGSSAVIVTNRASWLINNDKLIAKLNGKISGGVNIEFITPQPLSDAVISKLKGAKFQVTNEETTPETRFTLINANRSGAEKLAIARGTHPNHEITIFDANTGPHILGMAKEIIRKSKGAASA